VNLNKINGYDPELCPPILRDEPVVHIPFKQKAIIHALSIWLTIITRQRKGREGASITTKRVFLNNTLMFIRTAVYRSVSVVLGT